MDTKEQKIRDEIANLFETYHYQTLLKMADKAGMVVRKNGRQLRRDELIRHMWREFFTPERVLASWNKLSEGDKAVLYRLQLREGPARVKSFRRELLRAELATPAPAPKREWRRHGENSVPYADGYIGWPDRQESTIFEDLIARLTIHGLVFSRAPASNLGGQPFKIQAHPASVLYIPLLVRQALPAPSPTLSNEPGPEPDQVRQGNSALLLRDLYLYWDLLRRNPVSTIQSGLVGKRWLKKINQELLLPDPDLKKAKNERETARLYLLRHLLQGLKLVSRRGKRLMAAHGEDAGKLPAFWSLAPAAQANACLEAWARLTEPLKPDPEVARFYPSYASARRTVLEVLHDLPPRVWIDPVDFLEQVQNKDANFLFADHTSVESYRGNWYHSYGRGYYSDRTQDLLRAFEQGEERYVKTILLGILFQLGIVELGYSGEEWVAFRLSRDLTRSEQEKATQSGKIIVQPNFQVIAMGPVPLHLLAYLDLFAERERVDMSVFEYRLSRDSVYRGQQAMIDTAEIIRFLDDASEVPLPQNVRRSLEEWAAHHERIVFRSGVSLVQARDGELLDRLTVDPAVGRHLGRKLSSELALINKDAGFALINALVAENYLPAVSGVEPEAADKSVIVHADGRIRPIHAVPSLHLRGRLNRLAERGEDGSWRLTPSSIRLAGGSRKKVNRILGELSKMHRGTLPRDLIERIKGWGAYYGDAAVETLTLVEFRDKAVMEELRQHPELKALLRPFAAGDRALAAVQSDGLEKLRLTLEQLGIKINNRLGVLDGDSRPEIGDDT